MYDMLFGIVKRIKLFILMLKFYLIICKLKVFYNFCLSVILKIFILMKENNNI